MDLTKAPSGFVDYYYEQQLIALVAEEDTCVGFVLAGIGERNQKNQVNFAVVSNDAEEEQIMSHLENFIMREEIAIILITIEAAAKVKDFLLEYKSFLPVILEIPSVYHPYNPEEDEIMTRLVARYYSDGDEHRKSTSA